MVSSVDYDVRQFGIGARKYGIFKSNLAQKTKVVVTMELGAQHNCM